MILCGLLFFYGLHVRVTRVDTSDKRNMWLAEQMFFNGLLIF